MVDAARATPSPSIPADGGAMRRRYFKQAKQVKVELAWEGEPVSPPPVAPRDRRLGPPQHLHYQVTNRLAGAKGSKWHKDKSKAYSRGCFLGGI